jgi:hypothetical protein
MSGTLLALAPPTEVEIVQVPEPVRTHICTMDDCMELRMEANKPLLGRGSKGELPALPLGRVLMELAEQEERIRSIAGYEGSTGAKADTYSRAQANERRVRGWRSGENTTVSVDIVDRVLIGLDLLWWEVFNERTVRIPILEAHTRRRQLKLRRTRNGYSWAIIRGKKVYGDKGPDDLTLKRIERIWEPPMDEEAEAWARGA